MKRGDRFADEIGLDFAARVEAVLALHVEYAPGTYPGFYHSIAMCGYCKASWPCPTVRLLEGEEP